MARIAIVAPRCAQTAYGGAELLALRLAQELQTRFDVEVLTTCATDYWTWQNELPPGSGTLEGVAIRRFPVDAPRALREFDRLSRSFRFRIASLSEQEQEAWIRAQGPYSTAMWRFLFDQRDAYDAFVFMPYLYATTYYGLPIVRDRAVLLPLAHEEWPLYFPIWDRIFGYARAFAFVTPEERDLLKRRFARLRLAGEIVYPRLVNEEPASASSPPAEPFMLYLGRIDESKGVPALVDAFLAHRNAAPQSPWRLVLAGPSGAGGPAIPEHARIAYLGPIDEAAKWALLRQCELLVMPSLHESLSIAMIEGWSQRRAALVDGRSAVAVGQVRRAGGGLWYESPETFDAALRVLDEPTRSRLGRQGFEYATRTYGAGNAVALFEEILTRMGATAPSSP